MRLLKLALRLVIAWRGSAYASVAAIALVSAIVVLAGSVWVPLRTAVNHTVRRNGSGELTASLAPSVAPELVLLAEDAGAIVSLTAQGPASLESADGLFLVTASRGDLPTELAFRELLDLAQHDPEGELAVNDAVVFAAHDAEMTGRIVRMDLRTGTRLVRVVDVLPAGPRGPEIVVHEPAATAPSTREGALLVRVRGDGAPLGAVTTYLAERGLSATGWREEASAALWSARATLLAMIATLSALALVALVPANLLLARRARPALGLLSAWGFDARRQAMLVTVMGAIASGFASAAGGLIGMGIATVMGARGRPASSLLPLGIAEDLRPYLMAVELPHRTTEEVSRLAEAGAAALASAGVVTPSIGWVVATVAVATLLGAVTALPSALISGRVTRRRSLWHW